jgi:hypothetical protein
MTPTSAVELDHLQDDLIRAVLYPFAIADYDGGDAVPIRSVQSSEILDGLSPGVVNEALGTAQRAGLILWDVRRIGAIRLSELGFKKFLLARDGFFDTNENRLLRSALSCIDPAALQASEVYQEMKKSCLGLGALPGQPCPASGQWQARRLDNKRLVLRENDILPFPACDMNERRVIWYFVNENNRCNDRAGACESTMPGHPDDSR